LIYIHLSLNFFVDGLSPDVVDIHPGDDRTYL
jgi:hypothetical protein